MENSNLEQVRRRADLKKEKLSSNKKGFTPVSVVTGIAGAIVLGAGAIGMMGGGEKEQLAQPDMWSSSSDRAAYEEQERRNSLEELGKGRKKSGPKREIFDGSGDCFEEELAERADMKFGKKISRKERIELLDMSIDVHHCVVFDKIHPAERKDQNRLTSDIKKDVLTERERDISNLRSFDERVEYTSKFFN